MGRTQRARQGDFLALMEPGATLPPTMRVTLIPLLAALLLEAAEADVRIGAGEREVL